MLFKRTASCRSAFSFSNFSAGTTIVVRIDKGVTLPNFISVEERPKRSIWNAQYSVLRNNIDSGRELISKTYTWSARMDFVYLLRRDSNCLLNSVDKVLVGADKAH